MNSLKKGEGLPLLNFEGGPRILLLIFEGGPGASLLNFEGGPRVPGIWSHFYTMSFYYFRMFLKKHFKYLGRAYLKK